MSRLRKNSDKGRSPFNSGFTVISLGCDHNQKGGICGNDTRLASDKSLQSSL